MKLSSGISWKQAPMAQTWYDALECSTVRKWQPEKARSPTVDKLVWWTTEVDKTKKRCQWITIVWAEYPFKPIANWSETKPTTNLNNFAIMVTRGNDHGGRLIRPAFLQSSSWRFRLNGRSPTGCYVTKSPHDRLKCFKLLRGHEELETVVLRRWNVWHGIHARWSVGQLLPRYHHLLNTGRGNTDWLASELATRWHCDQQMTNLLHLWSTSSPTIQQVRRNYTLST